jgi:hypothetical protein
MRRERKTGSMRFEQESLCEFRDLEASLFDRELVERANPE